MSTFTPFSRLPKELRLRIWELTVEPRIVDMSMSDRCWACPEDYPSPVTNAPGPGPLRTCRESRLELQRHYQRGFQELGNMDNLPARYVWVNFEIDIIYIGDGSRLDTYLPVAAQIKRLKIDAEISDHHFYYEALQDLQSYTSLREIFIVCMDGMSTWWRALEQHKWPCGEENVWLIHPDNGNMMRGHENDAIVLKERRDRSHRAGHDHDTGLRLGIFWLFRRAMRRRAAAISKP